VLNRIAKELEIFHSIKEDTSKKYMKYKIMIDNKEIKDQILCDELYDGFNLYTLNFESFKEDLGLEKPETLEIR